jgi:hypothetical protein
MAIIAAHGGLAEGARYFRVVKDDVDLAIASSALSGFFAEVGVVVLSCARGGGSINIPVPARPSDP